VPGYRRAPRTAIQRAAQESRRTPVIPLRPLLRRRSSGTTGACGQSLRLSRLGLCPVATANCPSRRATRGLAGQPPSWEGKLTKPLQQARRRVADAGGIGAADPTAEAAMRARYIIGKIPVLDTNTPKMACRSVDDAGRPHRKDYTGTTAMNLPAADRALIQPEKLRDDLLSTEHPVGRFKAAFFGRMGYSRQGWQRLQMDILQLARSAVAVERQMSNFGQKYEVNGILRGPSGREARVTTVWIVKNGEDFPRFVTVYPGDGQ